MKLLYVCVAIWLAAALLRGNGYDTYGAYADNVGLALTIVCFIRLFRANLAVRKDYEAAYPRPPASQP